MRRWRGRRRGWEGSRRGGDDEGGWGEALLKLELQLGFLHNCCLSCLLQIMQAQYVIIAGFSSIRHNP